MAAYTVERPAAIVIYPEEEALPALRLIGGEMPDFRREGGDVYVFPEDLIWTMAFTHHEHLGPYFSRQEWVIKYGPGGPV
jgi:hypothetical protein